MNENHLATALKAEIYDLHKTYGDQLSSLRGFISQMAQKLEVMDEQGNVSFVDFEKRLDEVVANQVIVEEVE